MILELQYQKVPYGNWAARDVVDKKQVLHSSRPRAIQLTLYDT